MKNVKFKIAFIGFHRFMYTFIQMVYNQNNKYTFDLYIHEAFSDYLSSNKLEDIAIERNENKYILQQLCKQQYINIHENVMIQSIDTNNKTINFIDIQNSVTQQGEYDYLVIAQLIHPSISWCIEGIDYSVPSPKALYSQVQKSCNRIVLLQYCDYQTIQRILYTHKNIAILGSSILSIEIAQVLIYYNKDVHFFEKDLNILGNHFDTEYATFFQDHHGNSQINFHTNTRIVKIQNSEAHVSITYQQSVFDKININERVFDILILAPNLQQINQNTQNTIFSKELELLDEKQLTSIQTSPDIHILYDMLHIKNYGKPFNLISQQLPYYKLIQLCSQITNIQMGPFINNVYYRKLNYDKFNIQAVGLPLECLKQNIRQVKQLIYSDYIYQEYVNNMQIKAVQTKEICEEYAIRVSQIKQLVDKTIDSSYMDFAYDDDNIAGCLLYVDDNGVLLGGQSMGVFDCSYNTDIISVAMSCGNAIQDILSMDFGGLDGISKPWNVLQMTSASFYMKLCDFEGVDIIDEP